MKKFNILIINHPFEESLKFERMLGVDDFRSYFVDGISSALTHLAGGKTDLVFIDVGSDPKEGLEICRIIKLNGGYEKIPVIFILDGVNQTLIDDCYDSGCNDYVLKPLNRKELLKKATLHIELEFGKQLARHINHILEEKIASRTIELEDSLVKLNKAKKELETLDIAKSEFLNLISHEIRTPLNGIMGSLRLIGHYRFTNEVNTYFSLLDDSVRRLEKFSNSILEASNLRLKGSEMLMFSNFNPVSIIKEIIELCSVKYIDKRIETALKVKSKKAFIHADIRFVRKCLHAVIDNAFKFSPVDGMITITVANGERGFLDIAVSDEGPGFSGDSIENIYEAMNNAHTHYDLNTGMGMHLAKLIVEAHSGAISALNTEPHGALIKIDLPLMKKKLAYLPPQRRISA